MPYLNSHEEAEHEAYYSMSTAWFCTVHPAQKLDDRYKIMVYQSRFTVEVEWNYVGSRVEIFSYH